MSHFNYRGKNLQAKSFKGEDLTGSNFRDADISGCDFTDCTLHFCNFKDSKQDGANFTNAKVSMSVGVLDTSKADNDTQPPKDEREEEMEAEREKILGGLTPNEK
jgi:uncharacterized protein YjbI with pentapeptide repeats